MIYIILGILFIFFCEIVGRTFFTYLNHEYDDLTFPIGFAFILAIAYLTTSILTFFNCSFYLIAFVYLLITLIFLFLLLKKIKQINFRANKADWIVLAICVSILMYYSLNTSFGDLSGFDTTHYLNLVTGNIGASKLNYRSPYFNDILGKPGFQYQYTFQSYYYLASVILGIFSKFFNFFKIEFYPATAYIWMFQIMFHSILIAVLINTLKKFFPKNYKIGITIVGIYIFGYGRLYFNSVFGFYGNSLRTLFISIGIMYTIKYLNDYSSFNKLIISIAFLAACSVSSTGVFILFFYLFGLFFLSIEKDKDLFKWYSFLLFIPTINLITIILRNFNLAVIISFVLSIFLYIFNNILYSIFYKKSNRIIIFIMAIMLMFGLSCEIEPNIFNFDSFFNNLNETYDMTLDYFNYSWGYLSTRIFKFFSLVLFICATVLCRKEKYIQIIWVLVLVIFNPFCCKFIESVNIVYYRAYDLIINPFLFIYFIYLINKKYNFKIKNEISLTIILVCIACVDPITKPIYYHKTFEPNDDFNSIYKMSNDEIDVIRFLKNDVYFKNLKYPLIATPNLLTQSMLPNARYIYGRNLFPNETWDESKYQIYAMFWPVDHYGDERQPDDVDYSHMCEYIYESEIDYLVLDQEMIYYDENRDEYYPMFYAVNECGKYPIHENERYSIYYFGED